MPAITAPLLLLLAAQSWDAPDSRARALGNAGVAFAEGPAGAYWNPALLATGAGEPFSLKGGWGVAVSGYADAGVEGETLATLDHIADLFRSYNFQADQDALNTPSLNDNNAEFQHAIQILEALSRLNEDGTGALAGAGGSIELRFGRFGFFHREFLTGGADPFTDFSGALNFSGLQAAGFYSQLSSVGLALSPAGLQLRQALINGGFPAAQNADVDGAADVDELAWNAQLALGDALILSPEFQANYLQAAVGTNSNANNGDTLYFNNSGVAVSGILVRETGVATAIPLNLLSPAPFLASVNAGAALKMVTGETFYLKEVLRDIESGHQVFQDVKTEFDRNRRRTTRMSMDLGISGTPAPGVTAGLSGRNLIPMSFASTGPDPVRIRPSLRGGVAWKAADIVKVGLDLDLLETNLNEFVSGLDVRQICLGAEFSPGPVVLRTGLFQNVSDSGSRAVLAAGLGFRVAGLHVDLDGQIAPARTKIEASSSVNGVDTNGLSVPERAGLGLTIGFETGF